MKIETYYPDEKGRIVINGVTLRIRENVKYKNYCRASEDLKRIKKILIFGEIFVILGVFFLIGSVGHIELYSLIDALDPWDISTYYIFDSIGTVFLILGFIVVKWGSSKETVYKRWIDEYLGQYDADEEAVG